jgi:hypothetical protein
MLEGYFSRNVQLFSVVQFLPTACLVDVPDVGDALREIQNMADGKHVLASVLPVPCYFQSGLLVMTMTIWDLV